MSDNHPSGLNEALRRVATGEVSLNQLLDTNDGRMAITAMAGATDIASAKGPSPVSKALSNFVRLFNYS